MWKQDIADTRERYRKRYEQFGYSPMTLGWNKDCQWVRFKAAFEGLRKEEYFSVLDVGCGFGDLLAYLRIERWRGFYTGIDLVPELLDEARRRYGSVDDVGFECADIANRKGSDKFDAAIAIGIFNHKLHQNQLEFVNATLNTMWCSSRHVVVCDFLSTASEPARMRDDLFYADPREIYEIASRYSRRLTIHHSYMPFEFQIKLWHDDSYSITKPVFAPYSELTRHDE
jgi:SAM-dependent methyltransferase